MKTKKFDTVKTMRKIRDELGRKLIKMTFKQQKEFIEKNLQNRLVKHAH